jgi:hypothetical protein
MDSMSTSEAVIETIQDVEDDEQWETEPEENDETVPETVVESLVDKAEGPTEDAVESLSAEGGKEPQQEERNERFGMLVLAGDVEEYTPSGYKAPPFE